MSMVKKAKNRLERTKTGATAIVLGAGVVATAFPVTDAWAQGEAPASGGGEAPAGGGDNGGGAAPAADQGGGAPAPSQGATPTAGAPPIFGAVAPPPPGVPIGGGNNTESSAQPVNGDHEDHFDYSNGGGGSTVRGDKNGYAYLGAQSQTLGEGVPDVHIVRRGDTLWGLCDVYFHNPYQWPRIWSYNPQLQNPHWIYPGDRVRLRVGSGAASTGFGGESRNILERHRTVQPETIFLRDEGYVEDEAKENWGELTGAPEERIFLADGDEVYLHIASDHDVKLGDELTVYRPTRSLGTGQIVQIQGTVRIDDWDVKTRVARGRIVETLDTIERGARVGPVGRRFDVVAPVRNETDLTAQILASVKLHEFFGQNQVVFIDKGADDGLKVGNRLFVMRRGDAWRQTLVTDTAAMRIAVESASPADMERVRRARDESKYPQEVTAELRVLSLHQHSATCLVTQSAHEIELGEIAVARRGY
jgi:hypothetical protein